MYTIIVYDVDVGRVSRVRKFLRRYLHWVQNSVFEGEITDGKMAEVRAGLPELIDSSTDSVYIYQVRDRRWVDREVVGQERSPTDAII